jgi:hypothetical protein
MLRCEKRDYRCRTNTLEDEYTCERQCLRKYDGLDMRVCARVRVGFLSQSESEAHDDCLIVSVNPHVAV